MEPVDTLGKAYRIYCKQYAKDHKISYWTAWRLCENDFEKLTVKDVYDLAELFDLEHR